MLSDSRLRNWSKSARRLSTTGGSVMVTESSSSSWVRHAGGDAAKEVNFFHEIAIWTLQKGGHGCATLVVIAQLDGSEDIWGE